MVLSGILNLNGLLLESLKYHPLISATTEELLKISIASTDGKSV